MLTFLKHVCNIHYMFNVVSRIGLSCVFVLILLGCGGQAVPRAPVCDAPTGYTLSDIQSVVDWINAMEKPLTLPCFVASLPRPLRANSVDSNFSAQPAIGRRSPRVFFFFDDLILTVAVDQDEEKDVPAEAETHLLELSLAYNGDKTDTIKGELKFPIIDTLSSSAPYQDLLFSENLSVCGVCHGKEVKHGELDGEPIFRSVLLRPPSSLPLYDLAIQRESCDVMQEPHRCAMLASLIDHGDLIIGEFPQNAPTIFNQGE